jgi:hypothetical protein
MSANPFDIKTALLAKHAQHVVLIHFPIALFSAAVAFDFISQWTKSRTLAAAAYFNLLLSAVSAVPSDTIVKNDSRVRTVLTPDNYFSIGRITG